MMTKKLTWRDVFDTNKRWYGYIGQAAEESNDIGYEYFCWNDRIYKNATVCGVTVYTETTYRICDFGNIYDSANL